MPCDPSTERGSIRSPCSYYYYFFFSLQIKNEGTKSCLDVGENNHGGKPLIMYPCHGMGGNQVGTCMTPRSTAPLAAPPCFPQGLFYRGAAGEGLTFPLPHPALAPPQYFEYTTQRDLRHNIGKQLCLRAGSGLAELGECQYRGKPTRVPPNEEWELAQVSSPLQPRPRGAPRDAGASPLTPVLWGELSQALSFVFGQDRLIKNPASRMCLTARGKHPSMVPCNPSDPHQLWSFT